MAEVESLTYLDAIEIKKISSTILNPEMVSSGQAIFYGEDMINFFLDCISMHPNPGKWRKLWRNYTLKMRIFKDLKSSNSNYLLTFGHDFIEISTPLLTKYLADNILSLPIMNKSIETVKIVTEGGGWSFVLASRSTSLPSSSRMVYLKPCGFAIKEFKDPETNLVLGSTIVAAFQLNIQAAAEYPNVMKAYMWYLIDFINKGVQERVVSSELPPISSIACCFDIITPPMPKKEAKHRLQALKQAQEVLADEGEELQDKIQQYEIDIEVHKFMVTEQKSAEELIDMMKVKMVESEGSFSVNQDPDKRSMMVDHEDKMVDEYAMYLFSSRLDDERKDAIKEKATTLYSVAREIEVI